MRIVPVLAFTLACISTALAQDNGPVRTISVTGTVEQKIAPDLIVWSISLTDTDPDMRAAKQSSDAKIEAVLALREPLGIDREDIETGTLSIRREYERDQHGDRGEFKHFIVSRHVTIRQRDLTRLDEFLDAFVTSAEMDVRFHYESTKIREVRAETRLEALKTARQKAEDMAAAVNARLGKALTIDEHSSDGRVDFSNAMFMAQNAVVGSPQSADVASQRFIPGAIQVQMTVYATFELL
jgi:uncharacterized protein